MDKRKMANANGDSDSLLGNMGNVGVDINLSVSTALLIMMAAVVPIVVFFVCKKVIK